MDAWRANCIALIAWQQNDTIAVFDMDIATSLSEGRRSIPWSGIPDKFMHHASDDVLKLFEPYLSA